MAVEDEAELELFVARLREIGPFDCRGSVEALQELAPALNVWRSLLRDTSDNLAALILREDGRTLVDIEISKITAKMTVYLNRVAYERARMHYTEMPGRDSASIEGPHRSESSGSAAG